jgi:hypothetical protein
MMQRFILGIAVAALISACYSYQPLQTNVPPKVGEPIHVDLTPEGTTELARYLGPRVRRAEGRLVSIGTDGALEVAVDFVNLVDGVKQPWSGEGHVTFPRALIDTVRERRFEKGRTILGSTALAGALIGISIVAIQQGGGTPGTGGGGGGGPPALRAPR